MTSVIKSARTRQKADEAIAGQALVSKLLAVAGATMEPHEDRPDLLVHFDGRTYGVEATAIVRTGDDVIPLKARAEWRLKVEQRAEQLCRDRDLTLRVTLYWLPTPPNAGVQATASLLVDSVEDLARPIPAGRPSVEFGWSEFGPDLLPFLSRLIIYRSGTDKASYWTSGWGNFPDVQPSELQAEIDRKAAVAINYPERFDGLWLLIYATGRNAAESLDMNEVAQEFTYDRRIFDRVFFLDARAEVAELRLG